MKKLLIAIIIHMSFTSCSNYYKAIVTNAPLSSSGIEDLSMKNKYFILRNGNQEFAMKHISVTADKSAIQCNLEILPEDHKLHLKDIEKSNMKYKKPTDYTDETLVLNEVHFYITPDAGIVAGNYTIALDKIQKIEVIEKDKKKTSKSHLVGGISFTIGTILIVGGIAAVAAFGDGIKIQ